MGRQHRTLQTRRRISTVSAKQVYDSQQTKSGCSPDWTQRNGSWSPRARGDAETANVKLAKLEGKAQVAIQIATTSKRQQTAGEHRRVEIDPLNTVPLSDSDKSYAKNSPAVGVVDSLLYWARVAPLLLLTLPCSLPWSPSGISK